MKDILIGSALPHAHLIAFMEELSYKDAVFFEGAVALADSLDEASTGKKNVHYGWDW